MGKLGSRRAPWPASQPVSKPASQRVGRPSRLPAASKLASDDNLRHQLGLASERHRVALGFCYDGGGAPRHRGQWAASKVAAIYVTTFGPDRDLQMWIRQKCGLARRPAESRRLRSEPASQAGNQNTSGALSANIATAFY